jgi:transposase-like protein
MSASIPDRRLIGVAWLMDDIDRRSEVLRQLFAELAVSSPMWLSDAANRYHIEPRTLRRWCRKYAIGAKLSGDSEQPGDWFVSEVRLKQLLVRFRTAPWARQ